MWRFRLADDVNGCIQGFNIEARPAWERPTQAGLTPCTRWRRVGYDRRAPDEEQRAARSAVRRDGRLRCLVHRESENVRPRVMTDDIQVEFATRHLVEVDARKEDLLAVPRRSG